MCLVKCATVKKKVQQYLGVPKNSEDTLSIKAATGDTVESVEPLLLKNNVIFIDRLATFFLRELSALVHYSWRG
jgi:hypothetical protein